MPDQGPKNAFFDSLEELKQVAGWDDDLQIIFSPYLRVFLILVKITINISH